MRRVLITGAAGQDGSYLAELLLAEGCRVYGLVRPGTSLERVAHLGGLELLPGDLLDPRSLEEALRRSRPDEVYNLAGPSFVPPSWDRPVETGDAVGLGALRLLQAVRAVRPDARVYQASSSEVFGRGAGRLLSEEDPHLPVTPYGAAKALAHRSAVEYREAHGLFVCCGIAFNHESPRRPPWFVSRKISLAAARIKLGLESELKLGALDPRRDWGWAPEYVEAMPLMLRRDRPSDYVLATGRTASVRDLARLAFEAAGLDWERYVVLDPTLLRPADPAVLTGDSGKAWRELGWRPRTTLEELAARLVRADLERLGAETVRTAAA